MDAADGRLDGVKAKVSRAHMIVHLVQDSAVVLGRVDLLQLRHVGWAFASMHLVSAVLLLLVASLAWNVWHPRCLDTFLRRLLIQILESVFVEVDGLGPIA